MVVPKIDKDKCIGCGLCESIAPKVFKMKGDKASVINPKACDKACEDAAASCPTQAIILEKK